MDKREFLEKLAKKLEVLDDNERQDILSEYTDTINEKVKRGQSEEEAVAGFGNIDDLVKEILSAYKINPDYEEKTQSVFDKGENLIKECANKIGNWADNLINRFKKNNQDINMELIAEIVIKIFLVLIALLVFKGIFSVFDSLGHSIFNGVFSPLDGVLIAIWRLLLIVIYILVSALLIVAMFKKYFNSHEQVQTFSKEEKTAQNGNPKETKEERPMMPKEKRGTRAGDIILLIVKIFVLIYVIIPFIIIDGFIIVGFIFALVYFIKGIDLLGLILLLGGMASLFSYLIKLIFTLLFGKSKPHVLPVIISVIMMAIGTFMFADMIMGIEYIKEAPTTFNSVTETKEYTTDKKVFINQHHNGRITKRADNSYQDGVFTLNITYDKAYAKVVLDQKDNYVFQDYCDYDNEHYYDYEDEYEDYQRCNDATIYNYISVVVSGNSDFNTFKENYNLLIDNLKDNKLYDYSQLYEVKIEVVANDKTLDNIEIGETLH